LCRKFLCVCKLTRDLQFHENSISQSMKDLTSLVGCIDLQFNKLFSVEMCVFKLNSCSVVYALPPIQLSTYMVLWCCKENFFDFDMPKEYFLEEREIRTHSRIQSETILKLLAVDVMAAFDIEIVSWFGIRLFISAYHFHLSSSIFHSTSIFYKPQRNEN